jgi:hypothetical protein
VLAKILIGVCLVLLVSLPWFLPRKGRTQEHGVLGSDGGGPVDGGWHTQHDGGHDGGHGGGDGGGSH